MGYFFALRFPAGAPEINSNSAESSSYSDRSNNEVFPLSITCRAFFISTRNSSSVVADPICSVRTTSECSFQQTCTPVAPLAVMNFLTNAITIILTPFPHFSTFLTTFHPFPSNHLR